MAETLLIRLASGAQGFRDWVLVDEQGQGKSPVQKGAPDAGVVIATRRVIVLVPGDEVSLLEARVPGRNRQRLLRAVPFVLEEQLASDVEDLHFALGAVQEGDRYPVAIVSRSRMDAWSALLQDNGIHADQWIPETLAVPSSEGCSVLADGDTVLVRSGGYAGFAVDADNLSALLSMLQASEQIPEAVQVLGSRPPELEDMDVERVEDRRLPLEVMAAGWAQGPVIDLLQGAYSRREEWGRLLRPWKASAALLLAGIILASVTMGIDYFRLSRQQEALTAEIEAVYRKAFPRARRVVNPRAQMEQQLKQLQRGAGGADTGFMAMFAETADVVRSAQGINVRGASYRDGRLDLDLQADSLQILDTLKQSLISSGNMHAEIQSATTESDQKVKSRIRIQRKGT